MHSTPLAAALAVITAVIAASGAQKVIDGEDNARRPLPDLAVDVSSRYALAQLVLRNFGGTPGIRCAYPLGYASPRLRREHGFLQ